MATISALYCHIPFCHTICPFCAFAVHGNRPGLHRGYLDALKAEIAQAGQTHQGARQRIDSLYIGGGTPSTLSLSDVAGILDFLAARFPFASDIEIAFEVNPEDAKPDYLKGLRRAGINRISLGLQSLDDSTLSILRRNHNGETGRGAMAALREGVSAKNNNYNVDLMFGIPGAPEEPFQNDLEALAALMPPHISLYGLDVEPGTLFSRDPAVQDWMAAHGPAQAEQYIRASHFLTGLGYRHYEVSNFCLPGREGRQNLAVWSGQNYLGFGTGAHSCVDGVRWRNHRHLRAYLRAVEDGGGAQDFREELSVRQMANEALMLALRQDTGLHIRNWEERWQIPCCGRRMAIAEQLVKEGRASWSEGRLALTPEGFLVADEATAHLMVD